MRIEVFYNSTEIDGRATKLLSNLRSHIHEGIAAASVIDVYLTDLQISEELISELFSDPVAQQCLINRPAAEEPIGADWNLLIEVIYKPGVTDPVVITARNTLETFLEKKLNPSAIVQTARQYLFRTSPEALSKKELITGYLHNPLIQNAVIITRDEWNSGNRPPILYTHKVTPSNLQIDNILLRNLDAGELEKLSRERLLALTVPEMQAIQAYFSAQRDKRVARGLSETATDVELEMIAQTWSEHCKHKILNATIDYTENGQTETVKSLFKTYIKGTTDRLSEEKTFLKSVFHDDSGVIRFDDEHNVCFKVETHNSPSALDPYGGSITGIVGVNRDILGTGKGARPIFNTNVLCFGPLDTPAEEIPAGLLPPDRVMAGVHHGIIDGGNQSGIPVAGGAFLFDDSYLGKPLVFCGTGGILPAELHGEESWIKHIDAGDRAVMLGGRIGKDGIHGATFSSLALDEESPTSAVQIGDPITQKKMTDFLLEARDRGLYKGITDNGAGGLSSSLGEMAEYSGGIRIDLDRCPLKYQGLAPWEILVSESQERMSLAVEDRHIGAFLSLARERNVEATVVGEFTATGEIEITYEGKLVGLLALDFLHDGLPEMRLKAEWNFPSRETVTIPDDRDAGADLLALLADPNIASKEPLVRQYDHEVQAHSVMKPFIGADSNAPSDGAVLRPVHTSRRGLTITHGICPRYGDIDTYNMAACAVDEAFRAHIACGGDPDTAAALDNFCWPDPVESETTPDGRYKLAQLVRCCRGLMDACLAYGLPLISGKDSMKNDARVGDRKISVRPTLLVSLMGVMQTIDHTTTSDFKAAGDLIYILGETRGELGGSSFERLLGACFADSPEVRFEEAVNLYRKLHACIASGLVASCHDLSDGGLAVAISESMIGGRIGARINLSALPAELPAKQLLFCETPSRFLVSIREKDRKAFESAMRDTACLQLGKTTEQPVLKIRNGKQTILSRTLEELTAAFTSCFRDNKKEVQA